MSKRTVGLYTGQCKVKKHLVNLKPVENPEYIECGGGSLLQLPFLTKTSIILSFSTVI